ncbi:MAG TPA: carboxypeptidase regulatory-like domain-containing protein [Vicinamibacterales bacterium]|nr:carboxypeptidase regulatory-like domain-containing protein [Vicinamibacterales bacterium]
MKKRRHETKRIGLALIVALLGSLSLAAADHSGQVTATGVPVPGATVTATQGDKKVATSTDAQGGYRLPDLADGVWSIRVEMPGFTPVVRDVTVEADAPAATWELSLMSYADITRDLPALPPPSAVPATQAPAPSAQGNSTARSSTPARPAANSGTFQRAAGNASPAPAPAAGAAGASAAATAEEPPQNPAFGATDGFLINGSVNNGAATPFAQSAAFGNARRALAGPRYSYSVGLNTRNSAWDASPYTFGAPLVSTPSYHNLNVSGTVGGPLRIPGIVRNGPFFTLSYQRTTDQTATTSSALMPTPLERSGDFSQTRDTLGRRVEIIDPETGLPFPDNVIPMDRISPEAASLLALYPLPNIDTANRFNYQFAVPTTTVRDSVSANVTNYSFNPRNQISGSMQYQHSKADTTSLFGFEDNTRTSGFDITANYTHRISPLKLLRLRNTFGRQTSTLTPFFANRLNVSGEAGIAGNDQSPDNWGPPTITMSSVASLSSGLYSFSQTWTNTSSGEMFWSRGRHSLTMGAEVKRTQYDLLSQQNPRGTFFFGGAQTHSDLADFMLGIPGTSQIAYGNADKNLLGYSYAAYFTDDFRLGPSLTMNLGVRWEYESPYTEAQGRLVNLDVAPGFTAVSPVVASEPVGSLTGREFPRSLVRPDKSGIQPRVAIAWRPFLGSSVIVRAGYGIYRNNGIYQSLARALSQQPPLSYVVNAENTPETPLTLANGFIPSPTITQNTYAIDPDFRVSDAHVWQASMQRDLPYSLTVNVTYLGQRGMNMVQQFLPNTYAPGSVNPCPTCPIGFAYVTSNGTSLRNSGQIQVRRRLRAGLTASAQYTLAKGTDNAATFNGTRGTSAQDWLDLDAERSLSSDDQRHQFGGQVQYTTGVGVAGGGMLQGFKGALVRGWTLTGNVILGSGRPLTPLFSTALPGTATNGTVRPALTGLSLDDIPPGYYLNPLAYRVPEPGEWGNAGRNSVIGPKQFSVNAGITRSFPLSQRVNLDWQVTATNLLNRVTYNAVNMTLNSQQFGLPVGTNDMRKFQTSIRMRF